MDLGSHSILDSLFMRFMTLYKISYFLEALVFSPKRVDTIHITQSTISINVTIIVTISPRPWLK